jgi:fatty acid-binding protein DegV
MTLLFVFVFIAGSILGSNVAQAQTGHPAQNEWNKIVEAAKKEGKVVVSVPASAELREVSSSASASRPS